MRIRAESERDTAVKPMPRLKSSDGRTKCETTRSGLSGGSAAFWEHWGRPLIIAAFGGVVGRGGQRLGHVQRAAIAPWY